MSVMPKCEPETTNEVEIEMLDVNVLKRCGDLIFNLFRRLKNDELLDSNSSCSLSTNMSFCSAGDTYMELIMMKTFDQLYDMMSHDLEKADSSYMVAPKLHLYDDLNDFMRHDQLHQINRYVFGNGPPSDDWEADGKSGLTAVRTWREQFDDGARVPNGLIEIYRTVADGRHHGPRDVAMVAFAVFGFVLGYDVAADLEIAYMYRDIEACHEPATFRRVHNAVSRRVRMFLDEWDAPAELVEHFDAAVAGNADAVAACRWTFDLLTERPGAVEEIGRCDIFTGHPGHYVARLRTFYGWVSRQVYTQLSDGCKRSSLLDDYHLKCLFEMTDLNLLFDDIYDGMLRHFMTFLNEQKCPATFMETFRAICDNEKFKNIIRFFVHWHTERIFHSSPDNCLDSNQTFSDSSSQSEIEEIDVSQNVSVND